MKALSIKQPWAELILRGVKDVENRTWSTKHRGPLLIHAGKTMDLKAFQFFNSSRWIGPRFSLQTENLRRGAIIGIVEVVKCLAPGVYHSQWHERGFHGWYLTNPRRLIKPIPYLGQLRLFNVEDLNWSELQFIRFIEGAS